MSKGTELSWCVVTVGGAHGLQLNVLQVEEVPVDMSPKGFLIYLYFILLLSLFKHGSWRPIKTHNQKLTACFFVLYSYGSSVFVFVFFKAELKVGTVACFCPAHFCIRVLV